MSDRAKHKFRINRENLDKGWKMILAEPLTRAAIWQLYQVCMEHRDVVRDNTGRASEPDTFRAIGKQAVGHWLEDRCVLADEKAWLITRAEHYKAMDLDGRSADTEGEE